MVRSRQQDSTSSGNHLRKSRARKPRIYRPASEMRRPLQLFRGMWFSLLESRELAWQLMRRDISAQYRESLLGIFWAVIPPVVTAAGFTFASNANVLNIGETELPYPAYVMFSMALWQTFSESMLLPLQKVTAAKMMLAKIQFPREALILAAVGQVFFNFSIKLVLIVGLFLWFRMPVSGSVILAPVALVHLVMLGTIFGTLIAPLNALYQDFAKALQLMIGTWLFLTPVVYPTPSGDGLFGLLVKLNPVTPLLVTTRELATTGVISDPLGFWLVSGLVFVTLPIAWLIYRLAMPYAIERFSS
ncbi:MAG: ABC transporter permease [Leptolyngbya sp. SIO3F4]|nr:ABC transporter permease [Leptolyngbya sp. SIO3F4]